MDELGKLNNIDLRNAASRQLGGLVTLFYFDIVIISLLLMAYCFGVIPYEYGYSPNFYWETSLIFIFWGGLLFLLIKTLQGFKRGRKYSIITARIILIMHAIVVNLLLIVMVVILWNRLKEPIVVKYLNYKK